MKAKVKEPLRLERVLGLSCQHSVSLTTNSRGELFFPAGNVAIRYNSDENRQKAFYSSSTRPITCQATSEDGRYLAVGERGHQPVAVVWDIDRREKIASLTAHKHGIGCLAFSPNGKYLVTAGFKNDRQLIVWDWMNLKTVAVLKLTNKVHDIAFSSNGKYFITCGDRHLKWWLMEFDTDSEEIVDIVGKPASIVEEHRNAVFISMQCGMGEFSHKVYCITTAGVLCSFQDSTRMMDQWIQLESPVHTSFTVMRSS